MIHVQETKSLSLLKDNKVVLVISSSIMACVITTMVITIYLFQNMGLGISTIYCLMVIDGVITSMVIIYTIESFKTC
jgi:hypothetical protein